MYKWDLGGIGCPHELQSRLDGLSSSSVLVLSPHHTSRCEPPPYCPARDFEACCVSLEGAARVAFQHHGIAALDIRADSINQPIDSLRFLPSSTPPLEVANRIEAGLLTQREMNILTKETGQSVLICAGIVPACRQHKNTYTFDHHAPENPASSLQELEARQTEVDNLRQTLAEMQQQFDAELKQRNIEKNLLTQALAEARQRQGDQHETGGLTNPAHSSATLGGHLREEILAMRLQPGVIPESGQAHRHHSQQTLEALERSQDEIKQKLERSESSRKQLQDEINRLTNERNNLEFSLQELRSQLNGDSSIEQLQIASLQQSLEEMQEALAQAKAAHQERERELQAVLSETKSNAEESEKAFHSDIEQLQQALDEYKTRLSQAQAERQRSESDQQAALDQADRSIDESKAEYEARIVTLQQQLQAQESSRRQLAQEKAELANSLNDETQRALEFAGQAQILDENRRRLQRELEVLQQTFDEATIQHRNDASLLRRELDQARLTVDELAQSRQQLVEALQQMEADLQVRQERTRELEAALDESNSRGEQNAERLRTELAQLRERRDALQTKLEQAQTELAKTQRNLELSESNLQSTVDEAERAAKERQENYEAKLENLQQQNQTREASRLKLMQEKANLANRLLAESQSAEEFAGQADSLQRALETSERAFREAETQHQQNTALLREELEAAQHTIEALEQSQQQLERSLQQTQAESQAEQEQLNQALKKEMQDARNTELRLESLVNSLSRQVESIRIKAIRQRKKRLKLEEMLTQQLEASEQLKQAVQSAEEKAEVAGKRVAELEQSQQDLQRELRKEIKASQEAWKKASESDVALQVAKLELASLKDEWGQEIDNLQARLEHMEETRTSAQSRHCEEKKHLQESLEESQTALKVAQVTIRTLKSDRQSIHDANAALEERFVQLESEAHKEQAKLLTALESSQEEIATLRQKMAEMNALIENPQQVEHLRQELERANDEKAALAQRVAGLREMHLEMERHQGRGRDAEMANLRSALTAAEEKRERAETLARQTEVLQRERQVQELAIETLTEEMDALARERAALTDERDRLLNELSEIRAQSNDDA